MASRRINVDIPIPNIEITKNGNWQLLQQGLDQLPIAIQQGYNVGSKKYADRVLKIIRRAIISGSPPPGSGVTWKPTVRGNKPYYIEGDFYRAIGIYNYKKRTLIGMPIARNHPGGLTLNQLAILLEFGNYRIPDRPLWKPAHDSAGGVKKMKSVLMLEIRRAIYARTGLKANQIK